MTAEGDAEREGRQMGLQVLERAPAEQRAWMRGVAAILGDVFPRNGLAEPPDGWAWAEASNHALVGSVGLAHLIPLAAPPGDGHLSIPPGLITTRCGMAGGAWLTIGRWESTPRQACPSCAGSGATA